MDFPHPEGPTSATLFPAGMVNEMSRKMGRSGWYPKLTFSKVIAPPWRLTGLASGLSCDACKALVVFGKEHVAYLWRLVLRCQVE